MIIVYTSSTLYIEYYNIKVMSRRKEMLSKSATMIMGLINTSPLNAYEIVKQLQWMNIKYWYNIADSTVYATIKSIEKKGYISGTVEKGGNMPDKTIYTLTDKGRDELRKTLSNSIITFDYDANIFSIAAFFIDFFEPDEQKRLLEQRLENLNKYLRGIENQITETWENQVAPFHVANVNRMMDIVNAEISGTKRIIDRLRKE